MYWPLGIPSNYTASSQLEQSLDSNGEQNANGGEASHNAVHTADEDIIDISPSRTGEVFATITERAIHIWQTKPTVVLATAIRSASNLKDQGINVSIHLQPDASLVILRTSKDYLIKYPLDYVVDACVYQTRQKAALLGSSGHRRSHVPSEYEYGPGDGQGIRKVVMARQASVRLDSGIDTLVSLDGELLIASSKSKAILRLDTSGNYDSPAEVEQVESLHMCDWLSADIPIVSMKYDRPMRLHIWLAADGCAYAVQRQKTTYPSKPDYDMSKASPFSGFCFHAPSSPDKFATCAAINARFSLIAIGCADSSIIIYHAKDYTENIPVSHELDLQVPLESRGKLLCMRYTPDGYALFVGFEKGWTICSVYGKLGASSFGVSHTLAEKNSQHWLLSTRNVFWTVGGAGLVFLASPRDSVYTIECVRSSFTACFDMANISRMTLQSGSSILLHRGLGGMSEFQSSMTGSPVWQTVQLPPSFLVRQWPVRCSVISPDSNYLAVAGRRGLAHYSASSGRWRTFENLDDEDEFVVRGGMCWYQHVLVAAVDADRLFEIRVYSREKQLSRANTMHTEYLEHAVIHMTTSGDDSLLVYTHENMLHHYIFVADQKDNTVRIEQVGKIGLHGIIRAPSRIRAINWVVPEEQREHGLPSQDVATACVIFLVDAKLVLLRPSTDEEGALKYDMRVIAHDVEYYLMTRETLMARTESTGLSDALMVFNGRSMLLWPDLGKVIHTASGDVEHEVPNPVIMTPDFYPLSAVIETGVLSGVEPEMIQRSDTGFAYCRLKSRTHLAIPGLLRHFLSNYDSPSALHMCESYQGLPFFAHSLEIMLHDFLEDAAHEDTSGTTNAHESGAAESVLPGVLSFISSFPCYLDVIVGCTRKTEMRTWETLFKYLAPVPQLFEETLSQGSLKTAGGLLLILHNFDEKSFNSKLIARLVRLAAEAGDWDLCKELARFLVGVDDTGKLLRDTLDEDRLDLPADIE